MGQEDDVIKCRCRRKAGNWQSTISSGADKAAYLLCCESSCVSNPKWDLHVCLHWGQGYYSGASIDASACLLSCTSLKHMWWFSSQLTVTCFVRELCMWRHTWHLWYVNPTAYPCLSEFLPLNPNQFKMFFVCLFLPGSCPSLGSLANGKITRVTGNGADVGTIVNYTCDAGYNLVGSRYSVCQTNSTWSHVAPTCLRK